MVDLFGLEPEKYWDFTKKYSKEDKRREIQLRIASDEYIGSLKKDGDYNRPTVCNDTVKLLTRSLSTVTGEYGDKYNHVPHISQTIDTLPQNSQLIGELYFQGKTSQDVGSVLRCLAPKAVARQDAEYGKLKLYVHDLWFFNGVDYRNVPYEERIVKLQEIYDIYLKGNSFIEIAKYAKTADEISNLLEYAFENEEEGIVLVKKNALVSHGKRTAWKTIKVKRELDKEIDCFFTGNYKEPTKLYNGDDLVNWEYWINDKTGEKLKGCWYEEFVSGENAVKPVSKAYYLELAGSLEIGILKDGAPVRFGFLSGVTEDIKRDIVVNRKNWTNRPITITAMQFTNDGNLRHGKLLRIRDDLDYKDCVWEKI